MIVVLDTNALIQIFGQASSFAAIREALRNGRLELAVSTPILLEYEEVILRSRPVRSTSSQAIIISTR